jgi:predicted ABC-type ATPase
MTAPVCTIIAGPNGAGKTTFALTHLRGAGKCDNFVNADLIAAGLSPLVPEREAVAAGRLFLSEIDRFIAARESFAFETTLSGRSYLKMIRQMVSEGWEVDLVYLWLPNVASCIERVAERVARGGHHIPSDVIERRYYRSVANVLGQYSEACSTVVVIDNSQPGAKIIFEQAGRSRIVEDAMKFEEMARGAER